MQDSIHNNRKTTKTTKTAKTKKTISASSPGAHSQRPSDHRLAHQPAAPAIFSIQKNSRPLSNVKQRPTKRGHPLLVYYVCWSLLRFCAIFSGKLGQPVESVRISPSAQKMFPPAALRFPNPSRPITRSTRNNLQHHSTRSPNAWHNKFCAVSHFAQDLSYPSSIYVHGIFTNTFTNLLILAHLANSLSNRRVVVRQAWPKLEICQQALTSRRFKLGFNQFNGQKHGQNQTV